MLILPKYSLITNKYFSELAEMILLLVRTIVHRLQLWSEEVMRADNNDDVRAFQIGTVQISRTSFTML